MRRDAALLARIESSAPAERVPVLRLFRFDPPGITLGHGQNPERDLDLDRCRADGVLWAVRPTGGRAIFHAEEWTYSLAAALDDPVWGGSLGQAYAAVSRVIVSSLARLGVPAVLATHRAGGTTTDTFATPNAPNAGRYDDGARFPALDRDTAACFASTARHEVSLDGRKLVGSAQRRTSSALLQQGSLLLGDGHLRLIDYLRMPEERRDRARATLRAASAHAGARLGALPMSHWADALERELGPGVTRLEGVEGSFRLTLEKSHSYTPSTPASTEQWTH